MNDSIERRHFLRSISAACAVGATSGSMFGRPFTPATAQAQVPFSASTPIVKVPGGFADPRKVLLWENTRKEIRDRLASGELKATILPTGSVEQHNEHMAMVADVAISTLIAQQIALLLYPQVIVAPPSPCGYAPYHMARKGSVTLRKETFQAYVFDVLDSLKAHGIGTMMVLNGHGGNHAPLVEALPQWRKDLGVTLEVDSYWNGIPKEFSRSVMTAQKPTSHAGEFETSIYMAAFPSRLRPFTMEQYDAAMLNYEGTFGPDVTKFLERDRRTFKDGTIDVEGYNKADRARQEEALLARAETGEALLGKAIETFAARMERMIATTQAGRPWPPEKTTDP